MVEFLREEREKEDSTKLSLIDFLKEERKASPTLSLKEFFQYEKRYTPLFTLRKCKINPKKKENTLLDDSTKK